MGNRGLEMSCAPNQAFFRIMLALYFPLVDPLQLEPNLYDLLSLFARCLIKWLEVRKVCPLCNMPVLQLAQQAGTTEPPVPIQQPLPGVENLV